MSKIEKSPGRRSVRQRVGGILLAVAIATGSVVVTATVAQAAQAPGCSVSAGVPKKSGGNITGTGSGSCNSSSKNRTFIYQIHRSQGWWHPNVAQAQNSGKKKSYSATATNCDAGSGSGTWQYFGQAFFSGFDASVSGNTGELTICG